MSEYVVIGLPVQRPPKLHPETEPRSGLASPCRYEDTKGSHLPFSGDRSS